ncbi:MAG: VOC family protein [Saprospiraceae bacterium]|nr:VOC family protein [Saprospiraceae bacterium]
MYIKEITLYSSKISAQKQFYTDVLGFKLLNDEIDSFSLKVGKTRLNFVYNKNATNYHFAFNIPSNQASEALNWLKKRVDILDHCGYELVPFINWNAEAMYFYDMDRNIVEFIARKNLNDNRSNEFSAENILEISEIGVPTDNPESVIKNIRKHFPIEIYSGSLEQFCAAGDERGLFIIIEDATKNWIPRDDKAFRSPFDLTANFKGKNYTLSYINGTIE